MNYNLLMNDNSPVASVATGAERQPLHFICFFRGLKLLIQAVDLLKLGFIEDLKYKKCTVPISNAREKTNTGM